MEFSATSDAAALALQRYLDTDMEHFENQLSPSEEPLLATPIDADVAAIASWAAANAADLSAPEFHSPGPSDKADGSQRVDTPVATDNTSDSGESMMTVVEENEHRRRKKAKPTNVLPPSLDDDAKPRKPTYLVRKEEKNLLGDEIRLLEARLELLKLRKGIPTGQDKLTLASVQSSNFEMEEAIHTNLLGIAKFHSLLSRHLHSIPVGPMMTHIHLSKDVFERRATLRAMRDMKLRRAHELTENRMQYVDHSKPYVTEERYITDDGVYHCKRFEILPFDGVADAKQVFDALMYYHSNVEIAVSDTLGKLTIREDMDMVEPTIWNHRLASAVDSEGQYIQELNTVGFSQFYEPPDRPHYGVVAMDAVAIDDLYPYKPHERVRRDITAAMSVTQVQLPGTGKRIIVLRRCSFLALHPPQFPVPVAIVEEMRAGIADWCGVMAKFLRNTLSPGGS